MVLTVSTSSVAGRFMQASGSVKVEEKKQSHADQADLWGELPVGKCDALAPRIDGGLLND